MPNPLAVLSLDNGLFMSRKRVMGSELAWDVGLVYPSLTGTGPLACLSLLPVADVDKVSNDCFIFVLFLILVL